MTEMIKDLLAASVELRQTHISSVFLTDDRAFKVKRPVNLGFLDFTTLEQRKAACEAEVRLNARLTPDVYLGVVPVTLEDGRHRFGGAGPLVDHAVEMVRLPDHDRADVRLAEARLGPDEIRRMAERVAHFHTSLCADEHTASFGHPESFRVNVEENFAQTAEFIGAFLSDAECEALRTRVFADLEKNDARMRERAARGFVKDGHGDLRLEHFYIDAEGTTRVLDCIEFNDRFRYGDVALDVAFLAMDLERSGRTDLAELFLAHYALVTGDYDLYPIVDMYESYRAFVRAKIAGMTARDVDLPQAVRDQAEDVARQAFLLALAKEQPFTAPAAVIVVGGIVGAGKTTLAEGLAERTGLPMVQTDRTRKELLGVSPTTRLGEAAFHGAYSSAMSARVYDEVLRRGAAVLSTGRSVILDGTFRAAEHRAATRRLAEAYGARFIFVDARAPVGVCRQRLAFRDPASSVSDAGPELLDRFITDYEATVELAPEEHLIVDTDRPPAVVVEDTLSALVQRGGVRR